MTRAAQRPAAVAFVAHSGTGKTTLIEALVPLARGRGLRVGCLKHDAHRFDLDQPGKDSRRFTDAGAEVTVIAAADKHAAVVRHARCPEPRDLIARYAAGLDLVLVEGWKTSDLPRIEVHRAARGRPLLSDGPDGRHPHLLAVAADAPVAVDVPVLPLDDPAAILDFLCQRLELP
jgi:molybdopterin-guanine dinucleotide biosynthesis protein MobB